MSQQPGTLSKTDRNLDIHAQREAGETLREIAERYRVTSERVRQICLKINRQLKAKLEIAQRMQSALQEASARLDDIAREIEALESECLRIKKRLDEIAPGSKVTIDDIELTVRTHNCLRTCGVKMISELEDMTEAELLRIPNFGRKSLYELNLALKQYGIAIGANRYRDTDLDSLPEDSHAVAGSEVRRLLDLLRSEGWSDRDLARNLGVSSAMIPYYRHRGNPTNAANFVQILEKLRVKPADFGVDR